MGSMVEACAECRKKCLLCHVKRRKSTPLVSSFFKVMITKRFSEVLFLPPKFAPTVSTLIEKEIPLEDSSGLQWKVKLTILENSLALHQGWDTFAFDHGLEVGDFVIFHYILGSHFVVQIFDKTGCEKLDFSGNKNLKRKRAKADRKSTKKCGPCHSTDKGSIGRQGSNSSAFFDSNVEISQGQCEINDAINIKMAICGTSNDENGVARPQAVSKAEFFEEPFSIINREVGDKEAEYRTAICDLSSLEMLTYNLDIDRNNKILVGAKKSSHNADPSLNSKNEVGSDCKGSLNSVPLLASKSPPKPKKNLGSDSMWSNGIHRRCQTDERTEKVQSRKKPEVIKMEQDDPFFILPKGSNDKVDGVMKLQATNTRILPSAGSVSCLIAANKRPFLELPAALPSSSKKRRTIKERRVVLLKDPDMRQWPVLYHETPKLKLLMSGWEDFCQANNIQPGDECTFGIESETKGIFRVSIARSSQVD